MADKSKKIISLLSQAIALLGGKSEGAGVSMPKPALVKKLKGEQLKEYATKLLGVDADEFNDKKLKSLLTTASSIVHDDGDVSVDQLKELCGALGIKASKKAAAMIDSVKEYLNTLEDSDDEEEEESEDDEEEEEESDEEEEDEEEEEEEESDDDEEESDDDEEEEEEESDDDEEEEEEDEDSDDDEEESDDDDDDEEAALSDKEVKLFNKAAGKAKVKKVKNVKELTKLLTDDDGDVAAWGEPYVKNEEGYCCGAPLAEKEGKKNVGVCVVTGKMFTQDEDGALIPYEPKKSSGKKKKK